MSKILNKLYSNEYLREKFINFYDDEISDTKISKYEFIKICSNNFLDVAPPLIFDFFDSLNVNIGVIPVFSDELLWSVRIFKENRILVVNDYKSRQEATIDGLLRAIDLFK